ncbi:nitrogenase component 1 [Curtanaerobium respiraculi]|uniref:nitrogenase component 1 n=1 Tax=Curtanaerobium respiraculi TaxID=2949669 RepID=UPI0024B38182|nr:nitrogenase component 1 [Curtanaerobium respiraculi]
MRCGRDVTASGVLTRVDTADEAEDVAIPIGRLRSMGAVSGGADASADGTQVVGLPIGENCLTPKGFARFVAPCAGGWGIARGAMQVPETVMLFTSPLGCGRHGSMAAYMHGYRDRMYYLDATEEDLVMGAHMDHVEEAVARIMEMRKPAPRAFYLFSTCVDDLLGSDYRSVCAKLERRYGIPFVDGHMDPISMTSSTPPPVNLQRSIYRFLQKAGKIPAKRGEANIIGGFAPVMGGSELHALLASAGYHTVRQMTACKTFDEFCLMRGASFNILLKPFGRLACEDMRRGLGIPWFLTGMPIDPDHVARMYEGLGESLGAEIDCKEYELRARQALDDAAPWMAGLDIAVGSSLNGSTFEIAAVLARAGANISFLIAEELSESDAPFIDYLGRVDPAIPVYPGTHPGMSLVAGAPRATDVAIGFDVARLAPEAAVVEWGVDRQPFGFQALEYLLRSVHDALSSKRDAKELMYSKGLVV